MNIGINGIGRIGRGIFRVNYNNPKNKQFKIVAIKDIIPIENVAYLLKYDSLYGVFNNHIDIDGDHIVVDGKDYIKYYRSKDIKEVPWDKSNVEILIESSGVAEKSDLNYIIRNKFIKKVICTWNFPTPDITIVCGINLNDYKNNLHNIISASTCTGNGLVPILHMLSQKYTIEYGHIVTIHPVLSDQKLIDAAHKDYHLGRMAISSIIPTSTSVVKSTLILHPELKGKLDCISYRVPTTIVSNIDIAIVLKEKNCYERILDNKYNLW